jgi:ribosome-binding protein aMBF1 (putative translation factor)
LWLACIKNGWAQGDLWTRLECSQGAVSRYLWGERVPDRSMAEKIREVAGVPTPTWDQPPKKAFTPPEKLDSKVA